MRSYFILRSDGSSIFSEGHTRDFIFHCYYHLIDRSDEVYIVVCLRSQFARSFPSLICLKSFSDSLS